MKLELQRTVLDEVAENGYAQLSSIGVDEVTVAAWLSDFARTLGVPRAARLSARAPIEELVPTSTNSARPNSLSARYGLGAFPFHVDTAHWPVPGRFTIMGCANAGGGERETLLLRVSQLHFSKEERELLSRAVFVVQNGRNSFYASILDGHRSFVRFDEACMRVCGRESSKALALFREKVAGATPVRISWETGGALVLDNWKMLHARSPARTEDALRKLLRVIVS